MSSDSAPPRDIVAETPAPPVSTSKPQVASKSAKPGKKNGPSVSLNAIMDLKEDAHHGRGVYHAASFVPDARFFVLAICTLIGRIFSSADYESSQFVTPPSLVAYNLYLLYFLLFYRDVHSKAPSHYARHFTDFIRYNQLLKLMDQVFITDEVFAILSNYNEWSPELLPNLQFVPSLGNTLPLYDIPYLVHPLIFLHGHNTLFNRADAVGHYGRFLGSALFSLDSASIANAARQYLVANLLGCVYHAGTPATPRLVQNWLSRVILPFVDPATHRQHLRRTGISQFTLDVPAFRSAEWNPYTFLFTTNSTTCFESVLDCLHACSHFSKEQLGATKTMSDLYKATPPAPGSYMIMSYSTPTWLVSDLSTTGIPAGAIANGAFETLHGDHTRFGIVPSNPTTNDNTFTFPMTADGSAPHPDLFAEAYLITQHAATHTPVPTEFKVQTRSEMRHAQPNVLVFNPDDVPADAAFHAMTAGLVVHNGNIDSTAVRTPNPDDDLPMIMSRYLDGFMSLRVIRPRFANRSTYLVVRQAIERITYSTMGLLWRSDRVVLPRYDADHNAPNAGGGVRAWWPFRIYGYVTALVFGSNVLTNSQNAQETPSDPRIMQVADAWSSFRVSSDPSAHPTVENTFFGINHGEVLFGRNSTLRKFSHPADLLRRN